MSAVCGQEAGSKQDCIERVMKGYEPCNCLMIGDAPGDRQAAANNGVLFYPIRPLEEAESWEEFLVEELGAFLDGNYAGERELKAVERFLKLLPVFPDWK